jgi:parallel beta-helix repeat protein
VINEVYYDCTGEDELNEFVELYNYGNEIQYLDGLVLGDTNPRRLFKFPGNPGETNYPIAPGEFVIIVSDAFNDGNPPEYNGTGIADWELNGTGGTDIDNPTIPNIMLVDGPSGDWNLSNSGDGIFLANGSDTNISDGIDPKTIIDGVNWKISSDQVYIGKDVKDKKNDSGTTTGYSINRCPDGVDIDYTSEADFFPGNITPKSKNDCSNLPTTNKKILWDDTHDSDNDWPPNDNSILIANITKGGYTVEILKKLDNSINAEILSRYNILIISDPELGFFQGEISAMQNFIGNGRNLWIQGETPWANNITTLNELLSPYNISFFESNLNFSGNITNIVQHEVTSGVSTFYYWDGSLLSVSTPSTSLATNSAPVLAVYNGTGSVGRIVVLGDSSMFKDSAINKEDNLRLSWNIIQWLNVETSCGETITSNKLLRNDLINCTGNGLNINADNIILDCNNRLIDGDNLGTDYGINLTSRKNVTIKNCRIQEFKNGIYLKGSSNESLILDNDVKTNLTNGYGIYLEDFSKLNKIINNTITTYQNLSYGIYLYSPSLFSVISENTITTFGTQWSYGIYLCDSSNFTNISENYVTTYGEQFGYGIFVYDHSSYNNIVDNTIITAGNQSCGGIYIKRDTNFNTVLKNNVTTTGTNLATGIQIENSTENTAFENTITTQGDSASYGIYILSAINNYIKNNSINAGGSYGMKIENSDNNLISNNNVSGGNERDIYLDVNSNNNSGCNYASIIVDDDENEIYSIPYDNFYVNANTKVCPNFYNIPDDSAPEGIFIINSSNITLDCNGASFYGGISGENTYGIWHHSLGKDNVTIMNCNIKNYSRGISIFNASRTKIIKNNISETSTFTGRGIELFDSNNNNLKDNRIFSTHWGIFISSTSSSNFSNNYLSDNAYGFSIQDSSFQNKFENNTVNDNTFGFYFEDSSNNTIMNNTVNSNTNEGLYFENSSENVIENNTINNNGGGGGINFYNAISTGSFVYGNMICYNPPYDISDADANSGDENTCDTTNNWNDDQVMSNCTYACPSLPNTFSINLQQGWNLISIPLDLQIS